MKKRIFAFVMAACMMTTLLGCNHTKETAKNQPTNGRYVEKQVTLPEGISGGDVFQLSKQEDALEIFAAKKEAGKIHFVSYVYKDQVFEENTPEWLKQVSLEETNFTKYGKTKVLNGTDGKSYLLYTLVDNETWTSHLLCCEDGKSVQEVTPEDWLKEDPEYHYYERPQDLALLGDGTLIAYFAYKLRIYNGSTYHMDREINLDKQYGEGIYADKDSYYLIAMNDNYDFDSIEKYQLSGDTPIETWKPEEQVRGSNYMDMLSDGSVILTGKSGLLKKEKQDTKWTQVVNGIYTTFALETSWCVGMTALDQGVYYAMFRSDPDEGMLMEYTFDATAKSAPDQTLTVYSVYDNPAVNQAAAMYTRQNPDVLVQVEVGIPTGEEENTDMNTVLQNLNTKLIAGEGVDVLVLDGLQTHSFIDKKMLCDISGVVKPMAESGEILKNIVDDYTNEDGSVYLIPLKISMNLLIGNKIDATKADTIETFAKELSSTDKPVLGELTPQDLSDMFAPYIAADVIHGKKLDKEALKAKLLSLKAIADNGGIVDEYKEDERGWRIWDLAARAGAAFENTKGFLDGMFPMAFVKLLNGSFTSFENAYRPIGEMGINSATKNRETAEDFLQFCLSFEMQDSDFYDGFPMNIKALENQSNKDRSGYEAVTDIELEDGQYVEFIIGTISKENYARLIELCKKVDKKAVDDKKISEVLAENLPSYLKGSSTVEDTVQQIEKSLNMYLAEQEW